MNHKTVPRRAALLLALALLVPAMAATTADAAKRRVPFGFFGTVLPPEMSRPGQVSDAALDQQMSLMARSGVESVRLTLAWWELEPAQGAYTFGTLDRLVAAAARHRLSILVTITESTPWNSGRPSDPNWFRFPPTGYRDAFAGVLGDGVARGELRPHDTRTVAAALVGALGEALVGPLSARRRGSNERSSPRSYSSLRSSAPCSRPRPRMKS